MIFKQNSLDTFRTKTIDDVFCQYFLKQEDITDYFILMLS